MVKKNESVDSPATSPLSFPETYYQDPLGLERYVVQEKALFSWLAPSKIEKEWRTREILEVLLGLATVLGVLLFFGGIVFLFSALALIVVFGLLLLSRPTYMQVAVTTLGIKIEDKYFYWPEISQFWFEAKGEAKVLYLRVLFPDLEIVRLIIHPADEEVLRTKIGTYLLYKKPQQTWVEKTYKRITDRLPFDVEFLQF